MSLRLKLLLLSLLTLALPWAGCQYARDVESVLRDGERQSLREVAETLAASLQGRGDLLYRHATATQIEAAGPYDLQPEVLPIAPFLDGYAADWPQPASDWKTFIQGKEQLGVLTGVHERMLFILLEVRGKHPVFDAPGAEPLDASAFGDRIWLGFDDAQGGAHQVFLSSTGPGPLQAWHIEAGEYGRQIAVDEPRVAGARQATPSGYRVELRLPLSMIGSRFGVLVDNRDERGAPPVSLGTLRSDDLQARGVLIGASPELALYLGQFSQPGLRIDVTTPAGRALANANALALPAEIGSERTLLAQLYRRLLDRPGERHRVETSAPILDRERRHIIGRLQVTQTADRWLTLRDRALTRLLNFTLITSALAVVSMLAFAAWLALRLSRLRRASESALTREGLVTSFPETSARDELGDVARSFSTLLRRLDEYTGYLRTLAGKLAHEIRTPLTIVQSSLENLESEGVPEAAQVYLERAREGSARLNAIVVAMGAATRVEEAIESAERSRFDLVPVLESALASYRDAFRERRFVGELAQAPVLIDGAPDLIVQMLDKLIDNALDFSTPGTPITLRLGLSPQMAVLEVENLGPTLPPQARGRLFESLWQSRTDDDHRPHFGLGLYIVRLIAQYHGGTAQAMDLPTGDGARFIVHLSRMSQLNDMKS